jgi:hypothetical protein
VKIKAEKIHVTCNLCGRRVSPDGVARLLHLAERHPFALLLWVPAVHATANAIVDMSFSAGEQLGELISGKRKRDSSG